MTSFIDEGNDVKCLGCGMIMDKYHAWIDIDKEYDNLAKSELPESYKITFQEFPGLVAYAKNLSTIAMNAMNAIKDALEKKYPGGRPHMYDFRLFYNYNDDALAFLIERERRRHASHVSMKEFLLKYYHPLVVTESYKEYSDIDRTRGWNNEEEQDDDENEDDEDGMVV